MSQMLSLEEAQSRLLALAPRQSVITLGCQLALGRYLYRDLTALRTQPAADLSAMDGYAICGSGPWKQIGESRAGAPFSGSLEEGQCTRISTGAHMPTGAESVLIQENAATAGDEVALAANEKHPPKGRHVRSAGFDFRLGETILSKGTRMGPAQIALAISAGYDAVPVFDSVWTQVLDSGDELAPVASQCRTDQIPASNGSMIAAMLSPYVGLVEQLGPVPDDLDALASALENADTAILVTSGGASVGDHDLIQQALIDWGAELAFWKVAIKPGKPLMVATRGDQVIVGLPGNPVSSFVTCFLFVLPLVRAAMGDPDPLPKTSLLEAAEDLPAVGTRREFLRGVSDGRRVRLAASQDSSALRALASANCLIDRPADAPAVRAGDPVPVYNLQNG